jgi:hypothetical protein
MVRFTLSVVLAGLALPTPAAAQARGRALTELAELHAACRSAQQDGPRALYALTLEPRGYDFAPYDAEDGVLWVDTRRNLRALGGSAQVFPTGFERVGFDGSAERARLLREARARGARLRVGFFLGFDERDGTLCLLRPAMGVTTAKIDLAYVELVDTDGSVLARQETERLRAYLDDPERQSIPGEGPRGSFEAPAVVSGGRPLPASWRASLVGAPSGDLGPRITRCYEAALGRGAERDARVLLRLSVDPETGRVARSDVELTTLGDTEGARCVARALADGLSLPAAQGASGPVELRLPVRLVAD